LSTKGKKEAAWAQKGHVNGLVKGTKKIKISP